MKYKRDFEVPDEYEERYSEEEKIKQAQIKRINEGNQEKTNQKENNKKSPR